MLHQILVADQCIAISTAPATGALSVCGTGWSSVYLGLDQLDGSVWVPHTLLRLNVVKTNSASRPSYCDIHDSVVWCVPSYVHVC